MYPLTRAQLLFAEVVHHWRRFVEGSPTVDELYDLLLAGFWRGELMLRGGDGRAPLARETSLELARDMISRAQGLERLEHNLAFWSEDENGELGPREHWLPSGGVEICLKSRIRLPDSRDQWTNEILEQAFAGMAHVTMHDLATQLQDGFKAQTILKEDFASFCDFNGYVRPAFWFDKSERKPHLRTTIITLKRFQRWLVEQTKGPQLHSKSTYRHLALEGFPGLSASLFDQEWRRVAPRSWQKPGRRRRLGEPTNS